MEVIKRKIDKDISNTNNIPTDTCFFDIETTGFNRNRDIVYLIGILYFDNKEDSWIISQYFANELKDEPKIILEATNFLNKFKTIGNYNGNAFDIPFVNHKLKDFDLSVRIDPKKSLDIYSIIRKNKNVLEIDNLKLKTVERYLNIYRDDIYTGKDCISFYKEYILTGNLEYKKRLLTHNFEDLYYLIDIMKVLDIIKQKMSFYIRKNTSDILFTIEDIEESKDSMTFYGDIQGILRPYIHYDINFDLIIENTNRFKITTYTNKGLVSQNEVAIYILIDDFPICDDLDIIREYDIPLNILLLKVGSKYILDNILLLLKEIVGTTV